LAPQAVLPGDEVLALPEAGVVRVGAGLQQNGAALVTNRAGVLRRTKGGKLWVEGSQKRCARLRVQPCPESAVNLWHILVNKSSVVVTSSTTAATPSPEVSMVTLLRRVQRLRAAALP
jgi:hypothetical protein